MEKEKELAETIARAVNDYGFNNQKFAEAMSCQHRTLQQSFMRLMVATIKTWGAEGFRCDDRNRSTHELCAEIVKSGILDNHSLFMI